MAKQFYQQVIDGSGNVSFVPVAAGAVPAAAANSAADVVSNAAVAVGAYLTARAGEQSTLVGAVGGAALAPSIAQNVADTLVSVAAGNYVGAVATGLPALIGIVGSLAAIFTPDKVKGLSDAQIQQVVNGLSHEQLVGLLINSAPTDGGGAVGNNAGVGVNTNGDNSGNAGNSAPVSTAVKTV